jgi:hypothetical protein
MNERYDDGLDEEEAPPTAARATSMRGATTRMQPRDDLEEREQPVFLIQWMTIPLFAAFMFAICGMVAAASVEFALRDFAQEGGVNRFIFVAVPGLFAMMFALVVYQDAETRITTVGQSLSRGILVSLLTWIGFSLLATWVWGPVDFWGYFSNVLLITGIVGGGPMLAAGLVAGALVGWLIKQRRLGWIMKD